MEHTVAHRIFINNKSQRHVFFTKHVPQPFAREWLRVMSFEIMIVQINAQPQKTRSLISGCGMSRGFHPRSACSLRPALQAGRNIPTKSMSGQVGKYSMLARSVSPKNGETFARTFVLPARHYAKAAH
jgi:hypothetical protein